jgi:ParB family chromosome partitioning protein
MQMFGANKTASVLAAIDGKSLDEGTARIPERTQEVEINRIDLPASQPRKFFDPDKMATLTSSIQEKGILEPLLVRPKAGGRYELIAGERRFRAAQTLSMTTVPIVVKDFSDEECLEVALIENLQREDLNPVEEVEGVLQLLGLKLQMPETEVTSALYRIENEHKGKVTRNVTGNEEITDNVTGKVQLILETLGIGSWQSFIRNKLPLLKLPEDVLAALRQGRIEYTKAKEIAKVKDAEQRYLLLQQAVSEKWSLSQIRQEISRLHAKDATLSNSFDTKVRSTFKLIRKSKLDPTLQRKLETYLDQIQALLDA